MVESLRNVTALPPSYVMSLPRSLFLLIVRLAVIFCKIKLASVVEVVGTMALILVLVLNVWMYLAAACSHHDKEDTISPERLEDLEKKWGIDVGSRSPV